MGVRRPTSRTLARLGALIFATSVLIAGVVVATVGPAVGDIPNGLGLALEDVPDLNELTARERSLPSTVHASDGTVIGRFRPETFHDPVSPDALPPHVVAAVLAAEDEDFYDHDGVDWGAVGRAALRNVEASDVTQGGSTITQQLVKNLFTSGEDTMERKLRELVVAQQLERAHDKDEILAAYLNTVFFGEGAVGVGAAAQVYFGTSVDQLSLSQAALLAGAIPAPSERNPRVDPEGAERRRARILQHVAGAGLAPIEEVEAALDDEPTVLPPRASVEQHPYFLDYVRRWMLDVAGFSAQELFHGGLIIEASINPALQQAASDAVDRRLAGLAPTAALAVVDVQNGQVAALVGGRSWEDSEVNLALGASGGGAGRQTGSSFKPFVLAAALEAGRSPADLVSAPEQYLPAVDDAQPIGNYTGRGYGEVTIADATRLSINTAYVALTEEVGANQVADVARRLGVESLPRWVGPSIGIGAYESSPLEMAGAYAAFARDGRTLTPTPVRWVKAADGQVLVDNTGPQPGEQAVTPDTARLVTSNLEMVIASGTGTRAAIGRPAAGKTGTSNEYQNAWFVGYTPQYATAVWVGNPAGNISMRDVGGYATVTGGSIPAEVWSEVMGAAHTHIAAIAFPPAPDRPPSTTTTAAPPPTPPPAPSPPAPAPAPPDDPKPKPKPGHGQGKKDD